MAIIDPIKNPFRVDVTGRVIGALGLPTQDFKINPPEQFGLSSDASGKVFIGGTELPGVTREGNQFFAMSNSPYQTDPSFLTLGKTPGQFAQTPREAAGLGIPNTVTGGIPGGQSQATQVSQQRTLIDIANSRPDVLSTARAQGGDPFTAGTPANTWLNNWWNIAGKSEFPSVQLVQPTTQIPPPVQTAPSTPPMTSPVTIPPLTDQLTPMGQSGVETGVSGVTPPAALPKDVYTQIPTPNQTAGKQFTSLRDIVDSRPDVQRELGQDHERWNQWWNDFGRKEYPNVTLLEPDDYRLTPGLADDFANDPIGSFIELYNRVLEESGVGTIRDQMDAIQTQIKELDGEYADDVGEINENPWLTEGVRISRIRKIDEKYDLKRNQLTNRLELFSGLQNKAMAQAQFIANGALGAFQSQQTFDLNQLKALADTQDFENIRSVQGGLFDLETREFIVAPKSGGGGSGFTSGVPGLTADDKRQVAAMGIDDLPFEVQNIIVNGGLSKEQQRLFIKLYRERSKIQSVYLPGLVEEVIRESENSGGGLSFDGI